MFCLGDCSAGACHGRFHQRHYASSPAIGSDASDNATYLFKISKSTTDGCFNILCGNGLYLTIIEGDRGRTRGEETADDIIIKLIEETGNTNYFYCQSKANNYVLNTDPLTYPLTSWGQTVPTSTSGNAAIQFIPVNLSTPVVFEEGYYRILSAYSGFTSTKGILYDASQSTTNIRWGDVDNANVNAIFKLEKNSEGDYVLKNCNTQQYLGGSGAKLYSYVPTSTSDNSGGRLTFVSLGENQYNLVFKNGTMTALNTGTDGAGVGSGTGDLNSASAWYMKPATDVEIALTTIGENSYATTYLPFPVSSATDGVSIYTGALNDTKDVISMSEVTSLPAESGAVIVGSSTSATFNILSETPADVSNDFSGTLLPVTLSDDNRSNYLVFGRNSSSVLGFYKPSSSLTTTGHNKAYILASAVSGTSAIAMNFSGAGEIFRGKPLPNSHPNRT